MDSSFDLTKMDSLENVTSNDHKLTSQPTSSNLITRDQEHEIMVSALRQVISNSGDGASPSNLTAVDETLPPPDAGPCPLCGVTGCFGCAFPRRQEVIKKEKKHKGVRKKPSGNWSAEIWDPSLRVRSWLGTFPTAEMAAEAYNKAEAGLVRKRSVRSCANNGEGSIYQEDGGRND